MGWGGIIAGALGGGANAVGQIADSQIDTNKRKDLAQHQADIDIAKQEAIARTAESIRREGVVWGTTGEGGDAKRKSDVLHTKEVGAAQTEVDVGREEKMAPVKAKTEGLVLDARAAAAKKAVIDNGSDPAYLKAERALAITKHFDDGAGLRRVQEEAARLELDAKKAAKVLIDKYTAEKDPVKKADLIQEMTVRGLIKPGEYDTEKVTEEKMTPDGTTVKTERTQKRKPGMTDLGKPTGDAVAPPQPAVDFLRKNPGTKADFDKKYGAGAADKVLGATRTGSY